MKKIKNFVAIILVFLTNSIIAQEFSFKLTFEDQKETKIH